MGLYIYITEQDRINMRKVADVELKKLFDEALQHDKTLMISAVNHTEKQGFLRKPKHLIRYTIYHECNSPNNLAYQARIQVSASGSKQLVMAYLYGIINGSYANQRNKQQIISSEAVICPDCHKYKKMQGNGFMHQLCECGGETVIRTNCLKCGQPMNEHQTTFEGIHCPFPQIETEN